ncbi:MAG: DNA mismatch repair protein MutS, partial [Clostridia bacterium]|nr:DNA mismatch repair protein MutS [Clostridia bacterium]
QSTFMVEMTETAALLLQSTKRSLIILDEVGRGTSTYDGMAIARAVVEYIHNEPRLRCRTLFATHYHELTALEEQILGLRNYNITARKQGGKLIFLRKIVPGAADDSYGIEVAKLAGVPDSVVEKAKAHLKKLESGKDTESAGKSAPQESQLSLGDVAGGEVADRLRAASLDTMTPIEAMNLLYELKKKAEG